MLFRRRAYRPNKRRVHVRAGSADRDSNKLPLLPRRESTPTESARPWQGGLRWEAFTARTGTSSTYHLQIVIQIFQCRSIPDLE